MKITVTTKQEAFPSKGEGLIIFIFEDSWKDNSQLTLLDKTLGGKLTTRIKKYAFTSKEGEALVFETNSIYETIMIVSLGNEKDFTFKKFNNILSSSLQKLVAHKVQDVNILYTKKFGNNFVEFGKNTAISTYLSQYSFDKYKSKKSSSESKKQLNVQILFDSSEKNYKTISGDIKKGVEIGVIIAQGVSLARDLVNEPASTIGTYELKDVAKSIQKTSSATISLKVLGREECRKLGMGAFLGVAQGSKREPQFIILHYKNKSTTKQKKLCFIGKSIVFDSGGLSIKPAASMEDMKIDMAGGAAVLGFFHILSQLPSSELKNIPYEIYGILPACENMISGEATRPGDIVKALNGTTIEVLNTDAEGRLTLADALVYAEEELKAEVIIDMATLTGACMIALGEDVAGLFSNNESLESTINSTANAVGDEVWPMPLHKSYAKLLKSPIADLKNIAGRYGGAITAALFLSEFVKKAAWSHIDMAGPSHFSSARGMYSRGGTGWGVQTLFELVHGKQL